MHFTAHSRDSIYIIYNLVNLQRAVVNGNRVPILRAHKFICKKIIIIREPSIQ